MLNIVLLRTTSPNTSNIIALIAGFRLLSSNQWDLPWTIKCPAGVDSSERCHASHDITFSKQQVSQRQLTTKGKRLPQRRQDGDWSDTGSGKMAASASKHFDALLKISFQWCRTTHAGLESRQLGYPGAVQKISYCMPDTITSHPAQSQFHPHIQTPPLKC